jgi:ElaB/YqjD/DUF883 family membrane-anchored ribosome-binding protein
VESSIEHTEGSTETAGEGTEHAEPSMEELQTALYHTDRWLRKITKALKDGGPEDEEAREKLALQLKRARRQVRANKPVLEGVREQFGFGKSDEFAEDDDYGSLGGDEPAR